MSKHRKAPPPVITPIADDASQSIAEERITVTIARTTLIGWRGGTIRLTEGGQRVPVADDDDGPLIDWRGCAIRVTDDGRIAVQFKRAGIAIAMTPDDAYVLARCIGQAVHALEEDPRWDHMRGKGYGYGNDV